MTFEAVPSLVIGLGGTGLKAVTLLKRDLLQLNQNTLPDHVRLCVIDTEDDIKFAAGGWGRQRLEGDSMRRTGPVSIDKYGEYAGITGDISELGSTIAMEQDDGNNNPAIRRNQAHRHINAWFQAKYYLNEANMPANVWSLSVGAGQYRQMGRLGLFSKLQKVTQLLGGSIDGMRRDGARRVNVHIVGSLAGGTGSALFADCAHLVKMIADEKLGANSATVFGHFVLAEAFLGTPEVQLNEERNLKQFSARTNAALRELIRLQGATPEIPYPVTYDPSGTGWMNSRIDRLLFDAAWLYDGKRTRNPLEKVEIQSGVAPTIAEAIMAFLDAQSSGAMESHPYAVHSKRLYGAGNLPPKQVTFSSLGTYTIELPIYHIVEGWSHALARRALEALLGPMDREEKTELPLKVRWDQSAQDGAPDQKSDQLPPDRAKRFLTEQTTLLVSRLADYGREAARTDTIRQQKVDEIVAMDADAWKQLLAPADAAFQDLVSQAHDDLVGSLKVKGSYFVDYGKFSGSAEQKCLNLQSAVDGTLVPMLGETEDVWRRAGGNVLASLEKLAVQHWQGYTKSLQKWMADHLNGTNSSGDALEKKHGKLGYVTAVLHSLADVFKEAQSVVQDADEAARMQRRPVFDGLDVERRQAFERMRDNSGFMNLHLRNYRDKSDEIAQFQKADIARRLVLKSVKVLRNRTEAALAEVQRWERILATGRVSEGGAYAIVDEGQREVEQDRMALANPTRWVVKDDEPNDTYIAAMRQRRSGPNDETAIKGLLKAMKWELSQTDAGTIRVDLTIGGEVLDKRAGEAGGDSNGRRNVSVLLKRCRQVFADVWDEMSVVDYLVHNYGGDPAKLDQLAQKVYHSNGTLLSLNTQDSPLKTIFMRAYRGADLRHDTVLAALYEGVSRREGILGKMSQTHGGVLDPGQPSQDRFKLTFITMSDLIKPEDTLAYVAEQRAYRAVSLSEQWRELHIFPAETNSLKLEREFDTLKPPQRRREIAIDVVKLLDDEDLFQLAMRCLAYGESDYPWTTRAGTILGEPGLLLHKHTNTNRQANPDGLAVWRLTTQPEGELHVSGDRYDEMGNLALPKSYDLNSPAEEPDLLEALLQLTVAQRTRSQEPINSPRVEDTLNFAIAQHVDTCEQRVPRGWTLLKKHVGDTDLEREVASTAAQIIRLAALKVKADSELARHEWAWRPGRAGVAPTDWDLDQTVRAQAHVDLWSALKFVADWETRKLQVRFCELAEWVAGIPDDVIVTAHIGAEEVAGIDTNLDVSGGSAYGSVDVGATGSPSQPEAGE